MIPAKGHMKWIVVHTVVVLAPAWPAVLVQGSSVPTPVLNYLVCHFPRGVVSLVEWVGGDEEGGSTTWEVK